MDKKKKKKKREKYPLIYALKQLQYQSTGEEEWVKTSQLVIITLVCPKALQFTFKY